MFQIIGVCCYPESGTTLGGNIQMDWTYATIHASENTRVILHGEKLRKRHVENPKNPGNEFVHCTDNFGNYAILSNFMAPIKKNIKYEKIDEVWKMYFDGAYSKFGKGAGIVIISPSNKVYNFAFKLEFEASNNVAEYEALLLGIETIKDMGIKMLNIKSDSDLVVL